MGTRRATLNNKDGSKKYVIIEVRKKRRLNWKKINTEEIYHLIDLLEMNIEETLEKRLLSDNQKNEAVKYDTDLIDKLESILNEKHRH